LVAGAVPDFVLLPLAGAALGVLEPVARFARVADDDQVGVAVAVEILGPAGEAVTVVAQPVAAVAELADRVRLPIWVLVPRLAVEDVHLAVLVHVGDGRALGAEYLIEDGLLPGDAGVVLGVVGGGGRQADDEGQGEQRGQQPGVVSHAIVLVRERNRSV